MTFSFDAQGGQKIVASAHSTSTPPGAHLVSFTPFIERTDGNLYQAALQSMWKIYGKSRGMFQLGDASLVPKSSMGGNAICWKITNPTADYCVFPTKDQSSGRIAALTVWVQ